MRKMAKRLLIVGILFLSLVLGGWRMARAGQLDDLAKKMKGSAKKETWINKSKDQYDQIVAEAEVNGTAGGEAYSSFLGSNSFLDVASKIIGPSTEAQEILIKAGITPNQGAVPVLASGIGYMMANPAANTTEYIADVFRHAGIAEPAYAQGGVGWSTLTPVMEVWKAFRNMAYLVFIFIFIAIGFMVMFRSKLGGQALVTIQTALPQIAVTLLLITFSYAIAALMIDLIYVLIYFVLGIFSTMGIIDGTTGFTTAKNLIFGNGERDKANIFAIIGQVITGGDGVGGKAGITTTVAEQIGKLVETFVGNTLFSDVVGKGTSIFLTFVFAIAIFFMVFKLFIKLIQAYIGIIFSIIFAPIILLTNAIPGKNSFGSWIKGLLANVLVFPVLAIMFVIGAALSNSEAFGTASGLVDNSGANGGLALPFIGGGMDAGALGTIIGLGFLMMMPNVIEMIQKSLGVEGGLAGMMGQIMEPIQSGYDTTRNIAGKGVGVATAPVRMAAKGAGLLAPIALQAAYGQDVGGFRTWTDNAVGRLLGRGRGGQGGQGGQNPPPAQPGQLPPAPQGQAQGGNVNTP